MRLLLPVFLLGLFLVSQAGAVGIKLSGNQDPACSTQYICITDGSFLITTNSVGGGYFQADNAEGSPITALNFDLDYVDPGCATGPASPVNLSFGSDFLPFASQNLSVSDSSSCTTMKTAQGVDIAQYLLSLNFGPGVPNNFLFEIDLTNAGNGDPNGAGGWVPSTTFSVTTASPEPMTYGLAGLGICLLAGLRFRRRSLSRG